MPCMVLVIKYNDDTVTCILSPRPFADPCPSCVHHRCLSCFNFFSHTLSPSGRLHTIGLGRSLLECICGLALVGFFFFFLFFVAHHRFWWCWPALAGPGSRSAGSIASLRQLAHVAQRFDCFAETRKSAYANAKKK